MTMITSTDSNNTSSITESNVCKRSLSNVPTEVSSSEFLSSSALPQAQVVRFASDISVIPSLPECNDDDVWYDQSELQKFEENAKYVVREAQFYQEEVVATVLFNKSYHMAQHLAESKANEEEVEELLADIHPHVGNLARWNEVANARRGLEARVSEKPGETAKAARDVVLQGEQATNDWMANDTPKLAKRYQEKSRAARIFAAMMGQADANALSHAEHLSAQILTTSEEFNESPASSTWTKPDVLTDNSESGSSRNLNIGSVLSGLRVAKFIKKRVQDRRLGYNQWTSQRLIVDKPME